MTKLCIVFFLITEHAKIPLFHDEFPVLSISVNHILIFW